MAELSVPWQFEDHRSELNQRVVRSEPSIFIFAEMSKKI